MLEKHTALRFFFVQYIILITATADNGRHIPVSTSTESEAGNK